MGVCCVCAARASRVGEGEALASFFALAPFWESSASSSGFAAYRRAGLGGAALVACRPMQRASNVGLSHPEGAGGHGTLAPLVGSLGLGYGQSKKTATALTRSRTARRLTRGTREPRPAPPRPLGSIPEDFYVRLAKLSTGGDGASRLLFAFSLSREATLHLRLAVCMSFSSSVAWNPMRVAATKLKVIGLLRELTSQWCEKGVHCGAPLHSSSVQSARLSAQRCGPGDAFRLS